ncbi:MAG: hypothetical protein PHY43_05085 [Verrucomicrobiales bacterium]|nr:hypothetical protein [Verrucomicrobiales bacterium]
MQKTLAILNELETAGLVERYAIGGAMAGFFYAEAVITEDLDAFVLVKNSGGLITLTPIYDFLKQRGATEEREHLWLAGTLVQLIPAHDALTEEAVREATEKTVGQTKTRVMRAEHLIAIALKTGRAKDYMRIALLLEEAEVDDARLRDILCRHQLQDRWEKYRLKA